MEAEQEQSRIEHAFNKPERDELGRLKPGFSGNPNGRPKGTFSLTTLLRDALALVPDGEEKIRAILFIEKELSLAHKGDAGARKRIWEYCEGLPKWRGDLTSGGMPIPIMPIHGVPTNNGDEEDSGDAQTDSDSAGRDGGQQDGEHPALLDSEGAV